MLLGGGLAAGGDRAATSAGSGAEGCMASAALSRAGGMASGRDCVAGWTGSGVGTGLRSASAGAMSLAGGIAAGRECVTA